MNAKEKIIQFLDNEGISKRDFYRQTGLSNGFLDSGSNIGSNNLKKIVDNYPQLSLKWLVMDLGETTKPKILNKPQFESVANSVAFSAKTKSIKDATLPKGIPLIPLNAMAGFGEGENQVMEYEADRYIVPEFEDMKVDFLIRVKGDSMYPTYNNGDIVACRKVPLADLFFQWNKVYVLDTKQGALIKRIRKGPDEDHISIVSDNDHYPPFDLSPTQFNAIALVMGVIKLT